MDLCIIFALGIGLFLGFTQGQLESMRHKEMVAAIRETKKV
jgi:hypothetical protein